MKFHLEQLSHNISVANISSLKVINDIKFHININKKSAFEYFSRMGFWIALPFLKTAQGVSTMGFLVFLWGVIRRWVQVLEIEGVALSKQDIKCPKSFVTIKSHKNKI